ncbi:hypothetical protein Tco_1116074 [Tanacetum coccineum]
MQEDIHCASSETRPSNLDRNSDLNPGNNPYTSNCLERDNGDKSEFNKSSSFSTNNDPLALVSDASVPQYPAQSSKSPQSSTEPYPSDNFQLDSGSSSTENLIESLSNTLALLTQSYKSHLPQTNNQLRASSNARNKAMIQEGKVVVQDQYLDEEQSCFLQGEHLTPHYTNSDDNVDDSQENEFGTQCGPYFEAMNVIIDSDVYEGSHFTNHDIKQIHIEDPIYDEAGPSYDSNNPFEVQDHDAFVDHMDEYHEVHEMQNDVQHNYVVDSDADYTSDSNIIPYDQYVEDNEEHVVQHFVGVQTALFKEVKEMEEIFDQMNNEVDKNTVDKQCAEIEKKNILIENENLIVNCLSTDSTAVRCAKITLSRS